MHNVGSHFAAPVQLLPHFWEADFPRTSKLKSSSRSCGWPISQSSSGKTNDASGNEFSLDSISRTSTLEDLVSTILVSCFNSTWDFRESAFGAGQLIWISTTGVSSVFFSFLLFRHFSFFLDFATWTSHWITAPHLSANLNSKEKLFMIAWLWRKGY